MVVGIFVAVILWLFLGWKNPTEKGKRRIRYLLAAILFIWEGGWHVWNIAFGTWTAAGEPAAASVLDHGLAEHHYAANQELPNL